MFMIEKKRTFWEGKNDQKKISESESKLWTMLYVRQGGKKTQNSFRARKKKC